MYCPLIKGIGFYEAMYQEIGKWLKGQFRFQGK